MNDPIYFSMLKSGRRIEQLGIQERTSYCSPMNKHRADRLTKVIEHFGWNIKELTMSRIKLPQNIIELLNFMPNLQNIKMKEISLRSFHDRMLTPAIDVENEPLNLMKLESIEVLTCNEFVLNIFKKLPAGVLAKINVVYNHNWWDNLYDDLEPPVKLFEFQHNIKEMMISGSFAKFINFAQMKLTTLILNRSEEADLVQVLQGQDELRNCTIDSINDGDLEFICDNWNLWKF